MFVHFLGNHAKEVNSMDLAACVKCEGESLAAYTKRFIHLKCQATDVNEGQAIESVARGLTIGAARARIRELHPKTLDELLEILEGQVQVEEDIESVKVPKAGAREGVTMSIDPEVNGSESTLRSSSVGWKLSRQ